ncbi:MAG: SBBP repeat-containing protein, partial [Caldilineae bacterium]|nr:SBBP repeat-containing protein [Caldilineae bacterium]
GEPEVRETEGQKTERQLDLTSDLRPLTALKLTFPGSNPDVRIEPFDPLTTTVSYFIGNDPDQWHPAVPVWAGVRYVDLYPGIDLEIGAAGARLAARPGADLDAITLRVEGSGATALDGDALRLSTAAGEMRLPLLRGAALPATDAHVWPRGPEVFEISAPFAAHSPAPRAPADDPADLLYSTFLGGSGDDEGYAVAVDETGRATVTGVTYSSDFPTTPGAFDPTKNGDSDTFVAGLNAAGSMLDYATFLGGSSDDFGYGVAVNGTGDATVTGWTFSSDFPTTPGAFDPSYNGFGFHAFVARLNAAGSGLDYATYLGGSGYDYSESVAVDGTGRATVAGKTTSSDFPATPGAFDPSYNGGGDAFVARLNEAGSALDYATFLGGSGYDYGLGVAVDETGRATVTGYTDSSNFPTTPGAFDPSYNGGMHDAFVVRLNAAGSALDYATFLGGSSSERGYAVAVDGTGRATVTGYTWSSNFPATPGAFDPVYNGGVHDAFVARLNAAGSALDYATFLGGIYDDWGFGVAVDGTGRATVTGYTSSSDFPTTPGSFDPTFNGGSRDAFVARLNEAGSALDYATFLGGSGSDCGNAVAVDEAGRATVTGWTTSSDFPTTPGAFDRNFNGGDDAFISKLDLEEPTAVTLAALQASNGGIPSVSIWLLMALLALALSIGAALTPRQTNASTGRRSTKAA